MSSNQGKYSIITRIIRHNYCLYSPMKKILFIILFAISLTVVAQSTTEYQIYCGTGKKKTLHKLMEAAQKADYTFFGELHNEIIAHQLELTLSKHLFHIHGANLILAAEMFETDNQKAINDYLSGELFKDSLENHVRLWPNHETDYQPLLDFAKTNKLKFVAGNIPRKYASIVFKKGLDSLMLLDSSDLQYICPLPFALDTTLTSYKELLTFGEHGSKKFMLAQAIKDATMANSMLRVKTKGSKILHFNGSYHSNLREGIVWHVLQKDSTAVIVTIAVVSQAKISKLDKENLKLADFIIVVQENSPKSYEE
jgi:uncharacterized iron-regulated protein